MPRAADTDIDMGGRSPHFKLWGGRVPPGSYARDGGDGPPRFKLWGGRVPPGVTPVMGGTVPPL